MLSIMRVKGFAILFAMAAVVVACVFLLGPEHNPQNGIYVDGISFREAGPILAGETVREKFSIVNNSSNEVFFGNGVATSCGCVNGSLAKLRLLPGEKGPVLNIVSPGEI
jgi:hypothetical protein